MYNSDIASPAGLLIVVLGGIAFIVFIVAVVLVIGRGKFISSEGKAQTRQRDQYWLEEDGRPSRSGPGPAIARPIMPTETAPPAQDDERQSASESPASSSQSPTRSS